MVKIGFIAEGATEKIILQSQDFYQYLKSLNLDFVPEVIDAEGNGNLLPHNIGSYTQTLTDKGATHIFILTDLDADTCITITKERIQPLPKQIVIVSVREIEAWFLSDTDSIRTFLNDPDFYIEHPEVIDDPFAEIRKRRVGITGRGVGSKKILANQLVNKNAFSILRASQHANCSSAKYFIEKINSLIEQ